MEVIVSDTNIIYEYATVLLISVAYIYGLEVRAVSHELKTSINKFIYGVLHAWTAPPWSYT